mgnify:CR=1 FL=1
MVLLIVYVAIALGFSFLCSIAEAVILSVTPVHIALLEQQKKASAVALRKIKEDINSALAAILTLNTIAHTVGAAGAGAQAASVFGSAYLGVASAILTLLILIFSEIIPKTIGAHYWRQLAPATAYMLKFLILILYPFVVLSRLLTRSLAEGPTLRGMNRQELVAMAELGSIEGVLASDESKIVRNLLHLNTITVREVMTPRTVVFSVDAEMLLEDYFDTYGDKPFSRIPVYREHSENVVGFVLRDELLLAKARGDVDKEVGALRRDLEVVTESLELSRAFRRMMTARAHMFLVVDEYGGMAGVVTQEDILEELLGREILDESDNDTDMQQVARKQWSERAKKLGVTFPDKD